MLHLILPIIISIFFISIGLYYKSQYNDSDITDTQYKVFKHEQLRYDNFDLYIFYIDCWARKLVRGKKLKPYQKEVLIDFAYSNRDKNDTYITREILEDNNILAMQFNQKRYESIGKKIKRLFKKSKEKNNKKEENNTMYDYDLYNYNLEIENKSRKGSNKRSFN